VKFACFFSILLACFASAQAAEIAQAGAPSAARRIGVAAAVAGQVRLDAVPGLREAGVDVASGTPILLGDSVTTGPGGRLQIMLLDETVFTIGPDAAMKIDRFVYDPATGAGTVNASIAKGAFRFVTGQVAKRNPSDMEVRLPTGLIGVRGTSVAGLVDGARATIVLLGPGAETDTGERVGRILVTAANTTVEVSRPGFAVDLAGVNVPPTAPFRADAATVSRIVAPLAAAPRPREVQTQPAAPAAGNSGSSEAAQSAAPAARQAIGQGPSPREQSGAAAAGGLQGLRSVSVLVAQQAAAQAIVAQAQNPGGTAFQPGALMTFAQLQAISTGKAEFGPHTVGMVQLSGAAQAATYTFTFNYDFGAKQTFNSVVSISLAAGGSLNGGGTALVGTRNLTDEPFAGRSGPAIVSGNGFPFAGVGGTGVLRGEFRNGAGSSLAQVVHTLTYTNGGVTLQGSGTALRK
jgi:FecR protein